MKRIISVIFILVACFMLLPTFSSAAEWREIDNSNGENTSIQSAMKIENNQHIQGICKGQEITDGYDFPDTHYFQFTLPAKSIVSIYLTDDENGLYLTLDDNEGSGLYFATSSKFDGKKAEHLYLSLEKGTYIAMVQYNTSPIPHQESTIAYDIYFNYKEAIVADDSLKNSLGIANFQKVAIYKDSQFEDVLTNQWYYENVKTAYELGIVKGIGANSYGSKNTVTLAETLALASRLHSIYYTGKADFEQGDVWYQVYLDYAISNGIIRNCGPVIADGEYGGYTTTAATREQFVCMMKNAFPDSEFSAINNIEKGKIPDVSTVSFDADAIYTMYNAGIVTGNDSYGTFTPDSTITRSEVAAIIARMVDSSLRKQFVLEDKPVEVTAVTFTQKELNFFIGGSGFVSIEFTPSNATNRAVKYTSLDPSIATVNDIGKVTALKAGSTQIKVTSANGKFSFCTVNVISTDARDLALAKDTYSRLMDSLYFPDTCTIYNVWVDDEAKYDRVSVYIYFSAETKGGYTRRATYRVMYSGSGEFVLDSTYDSRVGYGREISITQVVN